jgi:hypothetical protein
MRKGFIERQLGPQSCTGDILKQKYGMMSEKEREREREKECK